MLHPWACIVRACNSQKIRPWPMPENPHEASSSPHPLSLLLSGSFASPPPGAQPRSNPVRGNKWQMSETWEWTPNCNAHGPNQTTAKPIGSVELRRVTIGDMPSMGWWQLGDTFCCSRKCLTCSYRTRNRSHDMSTPPEQFSGCSHAQHMLWHYGPVIDFPLNVRTGSQFEWTSHNP